jgi:hypothetical protein
MSAIILFGVIFTAILVLSTKVAKNEHLYQDYYPGYQKETRPIDAMPPSHEFYRAIPRNYF